MKISRKKQRKTTQEAQLDLFENTNSLTSFTRFCHRKLNSSSSGKLTEQELLKTAYDANQSYKERLIELRKNIQAFSELTLNENTLGMSDASVTVGESSPNAKYSNHDILLCIDLRLGGMTLKDISRKMEIPIRTLRDIFEGRRRAVLPTKFK